MATIDNLEDQPSAYQNITTKDMGDALARYIIRASGVAIVGMPRVTEAAASPGGK